MARLGALKAKLADAENRLGRLYAAIESGVADLTDLTLKDRVAAVKTERDIAQTAYDRALAETSPRPDHARQDRRLRRGHAAQHPDRRHALPPRLHPFSDRPGGGGRRGNPIATRRT